MKNSIVANNDGIWPGNNCQGVIYDGSHNLQYAPAAANGASCGATIPVADPQLQRVFAAIAADERRHANLAWAVDDWVRPRLTVAERRSVDGARAAAIRQLAA